MKVDGDADEAAAFQVPEVVEPAERAIAGAEPIRATIS